MSNVAIDLTKTVKEIITTMKTAIDNLNTDVSSNKTAIDNLNTAIDNLKGQVLQAVYPVGSVYVNITDNRNPADILGFGTWEALPAGYGLVAQGTATAEDGSTLTFTAGQKSGEFKHQITIRELASHSHIVAKTSAIVGWQGNSPEGAYGDITTGTTIKKTKPETYESGGNQPHNNISPCVAVYMWERKA